jgi:uncharacterized membrane protein YagU involved in acid resistance
MAASIAMFVIKRSRAYKSILWGGLIAGALDLTAAFITNGWRGLGPLRILQSIASGLLGADAFKGGFAVAALGVALHFLIAFGAAAVFYVLSRKFKFLVRQAVLCGLLYGIAVYWFMNLVVLPLSAIPFKVSLRPALLITGLVVHMLCVGLPIALTVRRYSK